MVKNIDTTDDASITESLIYLDCSIYVGCYNLFRRGFPGVPRPVVQGSIGMDFGSKGGGRGIWLLRNYLYCLSAMF